MNRGALVLTILLSMAFAAGFTQSGYQVIAGWTRLPGGAELGPVASVAIDHKGLIHILRRGEPAFYTLDSPGNFIKSWGAGMFDWTHGLRVDHEGFIWATDGRGHTVMKFSPEGELLMTLGKRGVGGDGPDTFDRPTDVAVAANGDFFVTDGYVNRRVVKFSREGKFIKTWGTPGDRPGEFNLPHAVVIDSRQRLIVADRENHRLQIFDTEGRFLQEWKHLGIPYGLFISTDDTLYVVDGIADKLHIANASDGSLRETIDGLEQSHWVSVDRGGTIYVAEVRPGESVRKITPKQGR